MMLYISQNPKFVKISGFKPAGIFMNDAKGARIPLGVIHKVRTLGFRNFRLPFPPVRALTLLAYTPSPPSHTVHACGCYFLKKI